MSELAKRAGVTTPALYWHFASKQQLCEVILETDYRDFMRELRERTSGTTPEERLRSFTAAYVELQLRDRELTFSAGYGQLHENVSDEAQAAIKSATTEIVDALKRILRDGQDSGDFSIPDLSLTTMALITMSEYVYVWFKPDGRLSPEQLGALYADLAINAVKPVQT